MGIGFPKLGFRFRVQAVPAYLGVAHSELKLSKPEALGRGGLMPGASHYLSSITSRIIDVRASWSGFWSLEQVRLAPDVRFMSAEPDFESSLLAGGGW